MGLRTSILCSKCISLIASVLLYLFYLPLSTFSLLPLPTRLRNKSFLTASEVFRQCLTQNSNKKLCICFCISSDPFTTTLFYITTYNQRLISSELTFGIIAFGMGKNNKMKCLYPSGSLDVKSAVAEY